MSRGVQPNPTRLGVPASRPSRPTSQGIRIALGDKIKSHVCMGETWEAIFPHASAKGDGAKGASPSRTLPL
jgi:hypothetical protein